MRCSSGSTWAGVGPFVDSILGAIGIGAMDGCVVRSDRGDDMVVEIVEFQMQSGVESVLSK